MALTEEDDFSLKFDNLGAIIVNNDGTMSRIDNWHDMTEREQQNTVRLIAKRNKNRREKLQNELELAAESGSGSGTSGDDDGEDVITGTGKGVDNEVPTSTSTVMKDVEGNVLAIAQDAHTSNSSSSSSFSVLKREIPIIDVSSLVIDVSCSNSYSYNKEQLEVS